MRAVPLGPPVEFPMGQRSAVQGGGNAGSKGYAGWWRAHAGCETGTFGGTSCGATKRCTGWVERREQGLCWEVTDACGRCHWDL
eukprot:6000356-Pyramimonas_sp.AAC.1